MRDLMDEREELKQCQAENRQLRSENERLRQACKAARKRILFLRHDLTDPIVAQLDSALNAKGTSDDK